MKKYLYLLRHARAEPWNPGTSDFSRSLSEKGVRHAKILADWMSTSLPAPDTVLCSPARRTRETLEPLLCQWPQLITSTHYIDTIYGACTDLLVTLAQDAFSYSDRLLMVGHNPGFHQLLVSTLNRKDAADIRKMSTGTLAVIGFPGALMRDHRVGKLTCLMSSKDLRIR